jgi:gliding motility-associated-like protein
MVSVFEGPIANFSFVNQCLNKPLPFTNLTTLTNGTYDSFWSFGDSTTSPINSPEHLYASPGKKTIKLVVTTSNGCTDDITKTAEVYSIPVVFAGNDTTISNGYSVQLNATGAYTYAWSPAEGLNNPTLSNPVANPYKTTEYIVEGTSINGCSSTDAIVITIDDDFLVIPYNIVTPNGNGKNDAWVVRNIERYPKNKITILDEWGVMVYEQKGYENNWEGRNSRGEILPDGTYFYVLTFEDNKKIYKGFITLLRNK